MLLYVHRDRKDCQERGAQDGHTSTFTTAPELWWGGVRGRRDYRVISQPGNELMHQTGAAWSLSDSLAGPGLSEVVIAVAHHPPTVESPLTPSPITRCG